MVVTLETYGGVGAEVARVARARVERSKRAEGRRRSTLARRGTRPRGAATSQSLSGWLKTSALKNIARMVVTLETYGGVGAEVEKVARASVDRSKRAGCRRRSPRRGRTRPRGAATFHAFSGWSKATASSNMYAMVVTLETCGGGNVGAEVASNGRLKSHRAAGARSRPRCRR